MRNDSAISLKAISIYLFLNGMLLSLASGELHYYEFVLKETNFTKLCGTKSILTVNGSFPGPAIRVHRGDTIYVNVHNYGYYGVTLHWHGIKLPRNPWSDGPEYVTQCSIPVGSNFTYEVEFTEEEGTLWWHAHSDWTQATVHGAIVILPPIGSSYPFPLPDQEEVIVFGCWYTGDLRELVSEALSTGADVPISNAYTINGEPGDFSKCSKETTYRMTVEHGKTYLLRLVNAATNANLFFAIAQHTLTVVGIDGAYIKPIVGSYIMLDAGRAMDVLVKADQPLGHYYMAARQYFSNDPTVYNFDPANATAILQYEGEYEPPTSPVFPSSTLPLYKDYDAAHNFTFELRSLSNEKYPINVPRNITTRMFLVVSMGMTPCPPNGSCEGGAFGNRMASSINNITWMDPDIDVLQAYYRNISGIYGNNFPNEPPNYYDFTGDYVPIRDSIPIRDTKVKILNYGEGVEIVFQSTNTINSTNDHPMHLHGHSFYVVGKGFGNFNEETDPKSYNLNDPPYMNTFGVPRLGWATIRFTANNPGVWFLHCHYLRHLSWGMNTVFITKNGGTTATSIRPPPTYMPSCNALSESLPQEFDSGFNE